MKILKLKLRGAIGIRKGLGIEEVEIDFSQFQPGLIALTGRNGSGKTTVMENLHPFRCMVSRSGSLQSHFYLKDSYRVLEFEHDGNLYESKILIDALTGGSEAYLFCNGKPINDGKLTTYDESIATVLGSQELFFNSVFSGQKSKGIAELKPSERRTLFYELLNLNIYDEYLEKAKTELKSNELKLAEIEGQIKSIETDSDSLDELHSKIANLEREEQEILTSISSTEKQIAGYEKEIRDLEIELSKLEEKLNGQAEIENKISGLRQELYERTSDFEQKKHLNESEIQSLQSKIDRLKKISENKSTIQGKLNEIEEIKSSISTLKDEKSNLEKDLSELRDIQISEAKRLSDQEKILTEVKSKLDKRSNTNDYDLKRLAQLKEDAKLINEVPCDESTGSSCKFLINAYSGKDQMIALETETTRKTNQLKTDYQTYYDSKSEFDYKVKQHTDLVTEKDKYIRELIKSVESGISKLEDQLFVLNKSNWQQLSEEAKEADNEIKLLNSKIGNISQLISEAQESYNKTERDIHNQIDDLQKKIDPAIESKIKSTRYSVFEMEENLAKVKYDLNAYSSSKDIIKEQIREIESQINLLKQNEDKVKKLNQQRSDIQSEITEWNFLSKAFDKTGIPVLKLENSGIEITSIANELLSLFENKFRIVFETTSLTKDKKKLKETFDINIVEDDGVCEIGNKSGGQQVWLETAIQLAISLVVRNQGRNIQTAFLDEKDGALDLENAYSYIEMLRKAHEMSGVHNTFVITHRTELLDFIPQQVKLIDGYLQILN